MTDPTVRTARARVRIRFAGTQDSETFQMSEPESVRFQADWKSYLGGDRIKGGEYMCYSGESPVLISINFDQIAYTEPGKIY